MSALLRRLLRRLPGPHAAPRPFADVLARFRAVLEDNARALQVINRMGETLGGEYLFDSVFVRQSYGELAAAMEQALESGKPVPGWEAGHETSLPEPLTSSPAKDSIAASLRRSF